MLHNSISCNFINFKPKHYLYTYTILSMVLQLCNILRNSVAPLVISQFKTQYSFLLNTGEEIFTWLSDISFSHMKKYQFFTDDLLYLKFKVKKKIHIFLFYIFSPLCLNFLLVLKCGMKYFS